MFERPKVQLLDSIHWQDVAYQTARLAYFMIVDNWPIILFIVAGVVGATAIKLLPNEGAAWRRFELRTVDGHRVGSIAAPRGKSNQNEIAALVDDGHL